MNRSRRFSSIEALNRRVVSCTLCPRLVSFRARVKPRAAFAAQDYWRRPVPGFGDLDARLLMIGLAPAKNGGLRTGRIFTGDASSRFLVSALYLAGFANQPKSESVDDGLEYRDCYLTAAVKCAPPADKPTAAEFYNCAPYLEAEISLLRNVESVLALGSFAFRAYLDHLKGHGVVVGDIKFSHGAVFRFEGMPRLYASYHPSPRNTNTGVLTQEMLVGVLERIRSDFAPSPKHN